MPGVLVSLPSRRLSSLFSPLLSRCRAHMVSQLHLLYTTLKMGDKQSPANAINLPDTCSLQVSSVGLLFLRRLVLIGLRRTSRILGWPPLGRSLEKRSA